MIHYEDWRLWVDPGPVIARQYDNLTRRLEITGDLPEGWDWTLLVQADREHLDLIALRPMEGGLGVDLTAEMLALSGYYTIQLRGNQGELVRHTNQVRIFIPSSLSGDANWPELPSEFSQAEADIRELNAHPPIPGDEGFWLVWDLERNEYVTSDLPLPDVPEGPAGKAATIKVGETITGDPGTQAAVENTGTENAAVLRFTIPRGAVGPTGATPAISVEVTGLPAGAEPTVSVSGTPEKPVISLGIPQGKQGDPGGKGDPGDPGQTPNITIGQVETLPAGSAVTASITGETPNLVLNLGIPQGQQGEPGQAATIEIAETETVSSDTPAAMVELPDSTPQARRYKAQVPQGIQGPAGIGLPALSGPEDAGKVPIANPDGTGWLLGDGGGGGNDKWKLLRSITIPSDADVETDQSGVYWNKRPNGGVWFGFDTDSEGNPLDFVDLLISGTAKMTGGNGGFCLAFDKADPVYGNGFSIYSGLNSTGLKRFLTLFMQIGDSAHFSIGCVDDGTGWPTARMSRDLHQYWSDYNKTAFRCFLVNAGDYGFAEGSVFNIYGR